MKVRRKPEPPTVLGAIQFHVGQPLPEGMHSAHPRSEDQSPVLDQPDGAPSMEDGDWILVYPNGERWRCAREDFKELYEAALDDVNTSDLLDVPLSDEELMMLRKLDSPPPLDVIMLSRGVQLLAIRATREIQKLRARLDLMEPIYECGRAWRTAPDRREADENFADLGHAIDRVLEAERKKVLEEAELAVHLKEQQ